MLRKKSVIYGKKWWVGTKHHPEQIFSICSANFCLTHPRIGREYFTTSIISKIFLRAYKFIKKLITRSFVNCFIVGTSTVTPPAIARTYSE